MAKNRLQSIATEKRLIWDEMPMVWRWHCEQTGQNHRTNACYAAAGILKKDEIIGSVVYHRYRWPDIEIGIHTTDPAWCTRATLREIFNYPFNTLNCNRVTATTDPANPAVCQFLKRLGFVEEGRLRQALPHGDSMILGMLRDECRWIEL